MSDENGGGGGCLMTILAAGLLFVGLLAMVGGDTSTVTTSTDTRSGVLSGNQAELLSRNQLNLFSEIWNCYSDHSCIFTEMPTVTNNETSVNGERNIIYAANGAMMCQNPNNPNEWGDRADWCAAAGVLP